MHNTMIMILLFMLFVYFFPLPPLSKCLGLILSDLKQQKTFLLRVSVLPFLPFAHSVAQSPLVLYLEVRGR